MMRCSHHHWAVPQLTTGRLQNISRLGLMRRSVVAMVVTGHRTLQIMRTNCPPTSHLRKLKLIHLKTFSFLSVRPGRGVVFCIVLCDDGKFRACTSSVAWWDLITVVLCRGLETSGSEEWDSDPAVEAENRNTCWHWRGESGQAVTLLLDTGDWEDCKVEGGRRRSRRSDGGGGKQTTLIADTCADCRPIYFLFHYYQTRHLALKTNLTVSVLHIVSLPPRSLPIISVYILTILNISVQVNHTGGAVVLLVFCMKNLRGIHGGWTKCSELKVSNKSSEMRSYGNIVF